MSLMRNWKDTNTLGGDLMKLGHPFVHDHYLFRKWFSQKVIGLHLKPEVFDMEMQQIWQYKQYRDT